MKVGEGINSKMSKLHLQEQSAQQQEQNKVAENDCKRCEASCDCAAPDDVMPFYDSMVDANQPDFDDDREEIRTAYAHHYGFGVHHGHQHPMGHGPHPMQMGHHMHMRPMGHPHFMGARWRRGCPPHMRHPPMFPPPAMGAMMGPYPYMMGMPMAQMAHKPCMRKMWRKMMKNCKNKDKQYRTKRFRSCPKDDDTPKEQTDSATEAMEGEQDQSSSEKVHEESAQSNSDQSESEDELPPFMAMMMMPPWAMYGMRGKRHFQRAHGLCKSARRQCAHKKHVQSDSEPESASYNGKSHAHEKCGRLRKLGQFSGKFCWRKCHRERNCGEKADKATEDNVIEINGESGTKAMD